MSYHTSDDEAVGDHVTEKNQRSESRNDVRFLVRATLFPA